LHLSNTTVGAQSNDQKFVPPKSNKTGSFIKVYHCGVVGNHSINAKHLLDYEQQKQQHPCLKVQNFSQLSKKLQNHHHNRIDIKIQVSMASQTKTQ